MARLKDSLRKILLEKLKQKPIVVWYDKEGSFLDIIKELRFKKVRQICFDNSYLELRTIVEKEDPELQGKWLLYIPEAPPSLSWLRDYELIGEKLSFSLPELYEQLQVGPGVFDKGIKDLLKGKRGRLLVKRWDELIGGFKGITKEKIIEALLIAIFDLPAGFGPGRIVTGLLEIHDMAKKLSEYGIESEFCEYIEKLGLKGKDKNYTKRLSAALFLSEASFYGHMDTEGLEDAIPERTDQKMWATWLRDWLKVGNKQVIMNQAKEVEESYNLKERLTGWKIADIYGLPCVDDNLLEQIRPIIKNDDPFRHSDFILDIAKKRLNTPWTNKREKWNAILLLFQFCKIARQVVNELKRRDFSRCEIFELYRERWWKIDRDYLILEGVWKALPSFMEEQIGKRASGIYREYLNILGTRLAEAIEKENGWWVKAWKRQNEIFLEFLGTEDFVIILADALRFDLAKRLSAKISDEANVEEIPTQGILPSITTVGMAALIPEEITIGTKKNNISVVKSGKVLSDRASRIKVWRELFPSIKVTSFEQLGNEIPQKGPLLVLSREIDLDKEEIRRLNIDTFEKILEQIAEVVIRLLEAGYKKIAIAADHGFLWLPRGEKPEVVNLPKEGCKVFDRRFAIGRFGEVEGTVKLPVSVFAGGDEEILFPKGYRLFSKHGEVSSFLHGGYLPQETILLSLIITPKIERYPLELEIAGPDKIDSYIPIFAIKKRKVEEKYNLPRNIKIIICDENGKNIGSSEVIRYTKEDEIKRAKIKIERPGNYVKVKLVDVTTSVIIDQKELKVVLPKGYEEVEL